MTYIGTRNRRRLAGAVALGAAPLLCSVGYQAYATRRDMARYPLPGRLVDVGGHRLHVHIEGEDRPGPVVLFEAGLSCPLDVWAWIQPAIARVAPTFAYDRAGLGGSDPGPTPRTAARMLDELDAALAATGTSGPYVLVGHSFGGLLIRAFAQRRPEQVAGMVLVDASHPDELRRSRRQAKGLPLMRAQMDQAATTAALGLNRLSSTYMVTGIADLPAGVFERTRARMLTAKACRTAVDELAGWLEHVNDEVRGTRSPEGCPLAVVTAGDVAAQDPVHEALQEELAALAAGGTWDRVPDADHLGLVMNESYAVHVTAAIERVLGAARSRADGEETGKGGEGAV